MYLTTSQQHEPHLNLHMQYFNDMRQKTSDQSLYNNGEGY
jgi:hypothetical protein